MPELADILRRYGPDFLQKHGERLSAVRKRALWDIEHCRTRVFGGQVFACTRCEAMHYSYHSCRNRACPKCHTAQEAAWLEQQRALLLPVPYFHTVVTVPTGLHAACLSDEWTAYDILMREAAAALSALAADPRFVGGQIGIQAVLHTWTGDLRYHPHVHMLVPGVGLLPDGTVRHAVRQDWLVPVDALSLIFRAKVRDAFKAAGIAAQVHPSVWRTKWNTYCRPAPEKPEHVLQYLGRYVFRVAITNRRILSIDNGLVAFRYHDRDAGRWATRTLPADLFLGRFVQHVLPAGFTKVRYYGFLAPASRDRLEQVRRQVGQPAPPPTSVSPVLQTPHDIQDDDPSDPPAPPERPPQSCPHCGVGTLVPVEVIRPSWAGQRPAVPRFSQRARAPP